MGIQQQFCGERRVSLRAGVWLGEAAALLARNTEYEIPYFKKAAAKAGAQLLDLERRGADYQRSAAAAAAEYRQVRRLPKGLVMRLRLNNPLNMGHDVRTPTWAYDDLICHYQVECDEA